jgi:hypothetical protein
MILKDFLKNFYRDLTFEMKQVQPIQSATTTFVRYKNLIII